MMDIPKIIGAAVGSIAIVSALYAGAMKFDTRYAHTSALAQMSEDSEQARLELQLELYKLELAQLRGKAEQTAEDKDREAYLVAVIAKITERLDGIVKGE